MPLIKWKSIKKPLNWFVSLADKLLLSSHRFDCSSLVGASRTQRGESPKRRRHQSSAEALCQVQILHQSRNSPRNVRLRHSVRRSITITRIGTVRHLACIPGLVVALFHGIRRCALGRPTMCPIKPSRINSSIDPNSTTWSSIGRFECAARTTIYSLSP